MTYSDAVTAAVTHPMPNGWDRLEFAKALQWAKAVGKAEPVCKIAARVSEPTARSARRRGHPTDMKSKRYCMPPTSSGRTRFRPKDERQPVQSGDRRRSRPRSGC